MDKTRWTLMGLILIALVAVLVGIILQLLWNTERVGTESADFTRTPLTQTVAAVSTAEALLPTATPLVADPAPTALSTDNLTLAQARAWPLLVYEPFDDNQRGWSVGGDGVYSRGERAITDGRYRWELTAVDKFTWWSAPLAVPFSNFYASLTVEKQDPTIGDTSLIFRYLDGDNYYEFGLCDDVAQYRVYKETSGTRTPLVPCTPHHASNDDPTHRLAVLAQTNRYSFFINEVRVMSLSDADHAGGGIGLGLDMNEGEVNVFTFDDMVVRSADLEK